VIWVKWRQTERFCRNLAPWQCSLGSMSGDRFPGEYLVSKPSVQVLDKRIYGNYWRGSAVVESE